MNDEIIEALEPVPDLESEPASFPESDSIPDPPVPDEPEPSESPPMEVISVDELLDRLTQVDDTAAEAPNAEDSSAEELDGEEPDELAADAADAAPDPGTAAAGEVVSHLVDMITGMSRIEDHLEEIKLNTGTVEEIINHPALTTSFAEYTVTEALLLFLLLFAFISACARVLRGGLSWLR